MRHTYVIADLHGRYDLLIKGLRTINARTDDHQTRRVIILGDFVDRGPQTRMIIAHLRRHPDIIVLPGNHEDMMVRALSEPELYLRWWFGNGGGETLRSYGYAQGDRLTPLKPDLYDDCAWLERLPVWIEDEHRIYVHAGVPFDSPVESTKPETLQWMLYPGDVDGPADVHADIMHMSGKHIVHGHHQSADHPLLKPHRTNLDSWAYHTGRLAIGVFDDAVAGGPVEILEVTA